MHKSSVRPIFYTVVCYLLAVLGCHKH